MNILIAIGAALVLAVASNAGAQQVSSGRFDGLRLYAVCDSKQYKCHEPTIEMPVVSVKYRKFRVESIPFFATSEPVEWGECQRSSVAEVCLLLGSSDIERLNSMLAPESRRLSAFVVGGKIISLVSIRGELRRSINIGPADDASPPDELVNFLAQQ